MSATVRAATDQATLPTFRLLMGIQVLATIVFGLVLLRFAKIFANVTGYSDDDPIAHGVR